MRTYRRQRKSRQSQKRLYGGGVLDDIIAKGKQVLASVQEHLISKNRLKEITGQALIETTRADLAKLIRIEEELQAAQARIKSMGATAAAAAAAEASRRKQLREAEAAAAMAAAAAQLADAKREIHNEVSSFSADVESVKSILLQREQYLEMLQRLLTESIPSFEKMADSIHRKISESGLPTKETMLTEISKQRVQISTLKDNILKYIESSEAPLVTMKKLVTELDEIKVSVDDAYSTLNGLDNIAEVQSRGVSIRDIIQGGREKIIEFRRIKMPGSIQSPGNTISEASRYITTIDDDFNRALNEYLRQLETNAKQRAEAAEARKRQKEANRLLAEQKAEDERKAALAAEKARKDEEARKEALARAAAEQKRKEDEEAAKEAAKAAAAAAAAKAAADEAARLAAEQAARDREAADAAAAAAAAAELAAQLAETRRVLEGMIQQKHQKSLQLKEQHNIEKYESNIEKYEGVFLRNKELQDYLFLFLSELDRIIYMNPIALGELRSGLSAAAAAYLNAGPNAIKANLFRFFVKGGAAPVLLFNKRNAAGIYEFTNDIDTIVLINPDLSPADYDQIHANLIRVIINVLNHFMTTYANPIMTEQMLTAIRAHYKNLPLNPSFAPRVFKYKIVNQKHNPIPEKEDERLGPALEALATEYLANPIFDIYRQFAVIRDQADAVQSTEKAITDKITEITQRIDQLTQQNAPKILEASQLDIAIRPLQVQYQTAQHIIINPYANNVLKMQASGQLQVLTQQMTTMSRRYTQLQQEIAANEERKANDIKKLRLEEGKLVILQRKKELEAQIKKRPLTVQIVFNYGYGEMSKANNAAAGMPAAVAAVVDPTAAANAAAAKKRIVYLNETLIEIKPNREPDYINNRAITPDLLDIVIPLQSNKFLRDDWRFWSVKRIEPLPGISFDVSDAIYSLFDQNRATRGSAGIPHLAKKYESRKARRSYLQAKITQLARSNNKNTLNALKHIENINANVKDRIMGPLQGGRRLVVRRKYRKTIKRARKLPCKN